MRNALICLLLPVAVGPVSADDAPEEFSRIVQPFLERHCYGCHGPDIQENQVRFDRLTALRAEDRHLWTLVHEQLSSGAMPPEGNEQPDDSEKREVLSRIRAQQRAEKVSGTRRLNRRELSAALQDVTGLIVDFSLALPGDARVNGFDTGAEALQDSADSVDQTMQVARRAVEALRFLESPADDPFAANLRDAKDGRAAFNPWKERGASASTNNTFGQAGTGLFIRPKWVGERGGLTLRIPPPDHRGVLRLTIEVSAVRFLEGIPNPRLWVVVGGRDVDYAEINNSPDEPRTLVYEIHLGDVAIGAKGIEIELSNRVEVPYAVGGFENEDRSKPDEEIPGGTGLFRPLFDRKTVRSEEQPVPFVVLHTIEIEPDYRAAWPPAAFPQANLDVEDSDDCARQLLALWMERAWRRPVGEAEQERFLDLYRRLRSESHSFDNALRSTFQSVLLSGSFRYLVSPREVDESLRQYAIASRLSFMLWGAPPEEELRQLAADGSLWNSDVLDAQVDRLLSDPRSDGFLRPFVTQWLVMDQPITVAMDYLQQQDFRFGRHLKASMKDETVAYVAESMSRNVPAEELISSDWTMMNDILARHYGYEGIDGGELRPVTLRKDDPRGGGILGQAGIQSMLCWMGENWPIYRGGWTLRHILDDPPPPPPLEVPELVPSDSENHGRTFRELLARHQEDHRCAVCHRDIDPLGFAFQNFDISGRWREVEFDHYVMNDLDGKIEWRGAGETRPVDAAGRLPRGETFTSFAECRALIGEHYLQDFVEGLMKNLVLYGAGRQPDIDDLAVIRTIMGEHEAAGYPLRDLLKALIRSRIFLER